MSASRTSAARRSTLARRRAGEVEVGDLEPRLQLDEQPLRGALADAGHEHERVEIVVGEAAAQRVRRVHRQDRERELRARRRSRAISASNVSRSSRRREPVEHHRVFAHVQVREQERVACPGRASAPTRQRHVHAVADAADLDEHLAARACAR